MAKKKETEEVRERISSRDCIGTEKHKSRLLVSTMQEIKICFYCLSAKDKQDD